ncbi:acetyl-CoA acetyltransferase, putative [Hepatocystis sp. ex Piliocolobus tephrosceles]|uniref:Acetyl-CoA acetyltransferase, mitochondrial n=1 Tax=Piliocolobus tephrosceles TaxID=591936 RepID=A0A8C9GTY3_9PRIM|nr:acetyl-CoA acetyltransferase, putative [Hepatocystis sp. ex Piliocolobus tephrosceles]
MLISNTKKVFIVGYARTPIGALCGSLSQIPAHKLAATAILKAIERSQVEKECIDCVILGQSFSSGCGPLPLQKVLVSTGININAKTYSLNNLCCSGIDSVTLGTDLIRSGDKDVCIVGGIESMSQSSFFLKKLRTENYSIGNNILNDSIISDGYNYISNNKELIKNNNLDLFCKKYKIPRVDLDSYVIQSFKRTADAYNKNLIQQEIFPLIINKKKQTKKQSNLDSNKIIIEKDELFEKINIDNICNLSSDSIITNYNISPFGDGACIIILMSENKMNELNVNPIAEIIAHENASVYPEDAPLSTSYAIMKVLKKINKSSVDYYEINETTALDVVFNVNNLSLDITNVNLNGGSLAIGHPTAVSGARIITSLISVLKNYDMNFGCAAINSYLGSSTSIVVENV